MSAASQFFGGGGGSQVVEVFAVGGGGNGGTYNSGPAPTQGLGGGGGAGQVVYTRSIVTPGKPYTITIGGAGSNTIFNDVIAYGGGPGGSNSLQGSGGGGHSWYGPAPGGPIGTGGVVTHLTPLIDTNNLRLASNGANGGGPVPAGGAGGGAAFPGYVIGVPGTTFGSGGGGGVRPSTGGANGTANTGNGGQGGVEGVVGGGSGGSGVLFIRFPTAFDAATVTGDAPVTPQPGYYVYQWTSGPGTITFN